MKLAREALRAAFPMRDAIAGSAWDSRDFIANGGIAMRHLCNSESFLRYLAGPRIFPKDSMARKIRETVLRVTYV